MIRNTTCTMKSEKFYNFKKLFLILEISKMLYYGCHKDCSYVLQIVSKSNLHIKSTLFELGNTSIK